MVRIGILGAGRIGQVHARAVGDTKGAKLVAISDPFPEAAQAIADEHDCDIRTVDEIAAATDIDGVLICSPTDLHADQIEQFARAGKAVFCEKPIDLNIARVNACLSVVKETDAVLMLGFNRRYDADFKALKSVIDEGRIGDVEMITITSRDPGPPPLEYIARTGGIFRDMTIHDFDVARWMLGEEVETVVAQASVLTDPAIGEAGDFDSVNIILRTASGKQAIITNSRRATYGYDQRIEVHGSKGKAEAGNTHEARIEVATGDGFTRPPLLDFFMTRYTQAYADEIAAFVACVEDGAQPPTTGNDGLRALILAEAALTSATSGRAVKTSEFE
ncbi:MAG: inositol 2-dehydrogenase [Paracoccaceae bacterium]